MTEGLLGPFRKVDPQLVDDDPFWSVVRRRHPDVDIVLLPGEPDQPDAPPDEPDPEDLRARAEALGELEGAWQLLAPHVAATAAVGATDPATVRVAPQPGGRAVRVLEKAVVGIGQERGTHLLRDVALALGRDGWRLRVATRAERPVLDAQVGTLTLHAEAGPGATTMAVTSWR